MTEDAEQHRAESRTAAGVARRFKPRSALYELTIARLRLFFREPSTVFWAFGFPILLSIALGVAFRNRPPEPVHVVVFAGPTAERTAAALASPLVDARVEKADAARRDLRSGKAVLLVSPGDPRTYVFDESRPDARTARLLVDDLLQRAAGRADVSRVRDERVAEPGGRYIDFLVPGLVGVNLMSSGMWGIGYAIVEMRTKKLVKRMLATPMRRSDFLLSFLAMRAVFVAIEVPVLFGFGWLVFGVRIAGSLPLLGAVCLLGAATFGGLGLLVASRAQNTQTVGGLMNLVMMPMFVGSGVFFSTSNFPHRVQPLLRALPLTALNDALRAIVNDGGPMREIAGPVLLLAAWGVAAYALALQLFRWR